MVRVTTRGRYRRLYDPEATWFFTVDLAGRNHNPLLVVRVNELREAFRHIKRNKLAIGVMHGNVYIAFSNGSNGAIGDD